MDLTHTRSSRKAAQSRSFSASLRRLTVCRAVPLLTAGALMLSAGIANAASDTYNGTGTTFTTGFAGILNGDTLLFGAGTNFTVNNNIVGLILGAGTNTTSGGTYLGDAIDFSAGAPSYTLTGNDVNLQGNIVNSSGVLQTINFNMAENGLTSPPYGYNFDTGTGGITLGGNLGTGTIAGSDGVFHDLNKVGSGTLTLAGTNHIAADIFSAGTVVVTGTQNVQYFNSMGRGAGQNTTLTVQGTGTYNCGDINVGDLSGVAGNLDVSTMNISGNATVTSTGAFFLGRNTFTQGTLNLTGGTLTAASYTSIGAGGIGVANVSGGSYISKGDFNVSDVGTSTGTLNLSGTGLAQGVNVFVGKSQTTTGVATITGGTLKATGILTVGYANNTHGTINISGGAINADTVLIGEFDAAQGTINQSGGTVTENNTGDNAFQIGGTHPLYHFTSSGVYNLSAGTLAIAGNAQIGTYGNGQLNQTGGTVNAANAVSVGRYTSDSTNPSGASVSNGTLSVTGGNFNQTNAAAKLTVGDAGTGTLTVGGTGTVTSNGGVTVGRVAAGATDSGTVDVAGGIGTVNLNTGGTLATTSLQGGAGTSTVNFNGGTLTATAASTTFVSGLTTANVQSGGAVINTNGNSVTITQPLLHSGIGKDGGLTKTGAGTLTLSGADTYTGATTVSAGQLSLTTIASLGSGNLLLPSSATNWVNLLFTGTENIGALSFNLGSSFVTPGTYGAVGSGAANQFVAFSGSGILNVTAAPEPSQYAAFGLGLLGLGGLALRARRRVTA